MSGILSIGISGIRAAQVGLEVTQHNIANASSSGYNRQYIEQTAGIPLLSGSGYIGSGTQVSSVRRSYDAYLTQQMNSAQTKVSESDAMLSKLSQLDNLFGDAEAGLAPAVQDFFTGVQQVAANPSLVSARQTMLSSAQVLTNRFSEISSRIGEMYDGVNGEVSSEVQLINTYSQQIANINDQIVRAQAFGDQPPNDLYDMREQLVNEMNQHVQVTTVEDSTGNFNVFAASGQQLVVGSQVNNLVAMTSGTDNTRFVVGLQGQSGSVQELREDQVVGGKLGGLLRFRSESLDGAANALGQVAASLALTFNAQHALGQDLDGLNAQSATSGFQANFFEIGTPKVIASSDTAAPVSASLLPASYDATKGYYTTSLTGSDYTLRASAGGVTLTRNTDGKSWSAVDLTTLNGMITSEGFSLGGSGPSVGDEYQIEPTRDLASNISVNAAIASDTSRIAAAAPTTTSLGNSNSGSLTVSQGEVREGYALSNLPMSFSYDSTIDSFNFTQGAAAVTATYADGSTLSIAAGTIPRDNAGSTLASINVDNALVKVSGLPANGDTFTLSANVNGMADSRNGLKLAALQTQNTTGGGKATFQSTYAALVSQVGTDTAEATTTSKAQQALLTQATNSRSSISGVNLDEEAANLLKYQQAYQASAKALQVGSQLFQTLLDLIG